MIFQKIGNSLFVSLWGMTALWTMYLSGLTISGLR